MGGSIYSGKASCLAALAEAERDMDARCNRLRAEKLAWASQKAPIDVDLGTMKICITTKKSTRLCVASWGVV